METITKINIEENNLSVDEALAKVEMEIEVLSLQSQTKVLKIIHGYGSKGVGGAIKQALPKLLSELKKRNKILDFVPSSKFATISKDYKKYTSCYPSLSIDEDLKNLNPGITIVFLK